MQLPRELLDYLSEHGLPLDFYQLEIPRFIRAHPNSQERLTLERLQEALGHSVAPIPWMAGFYQCSWQVSLSQSELYQRGDILGMDISSAVAVQALDVKSTDHVLDLCCAPGAKLLFIAHLLNPTQKIPFTGTVTGVDLSKDRLAVCRSLMRKHGIINAQLYHGDGTTFDILAPKWSIARLNRRDPPNLNRPISESGMGARCFHSPQTLRGNQHFADEECLYDKVLVDAECTHDGSISHILKYKKNEEWDDLSKLSLSPEKQAGLENLQRALILNGFKLLKPEGTMVYSTCSLTRRQNEDIIEWFLAKCPTASIVPIDVHPEFPRDSISQCESLPCLRMDPLRSKTSGLFVAKFLKMIEPFAQ